MPELAADIAVHVQHSLELMQAVPVKKDQMLAFFGIRRESHRDHVDQRNDIEYQNTDAGKRHQGDMKVAVEQILHILAKARYFFPFFNHFLQLVRMSKLQDPERNETCDDKACDHACEQDLLRIVTG